MGDSVALTPLHTAMVKEKGNENLSKCRFLCYYESHRKLDLCYIVASLIANVETDTSLQILFYGVFVYCEIKFKIER